MARFVDLDEEDGEPAPMPGQLPLEQLVQKQKQNQEQHLLLLRKLHVHVQGGSVARWPEGFYDIRSNNNDMDVSTFRSAATDALQCYPIAIAIASSIDLNDLDSLSRTCRRIHNGLLQYRTILLNSTMHCCNESIPVDPDETFRYRARAGNWFYMEDGRNFGGKSGDCARDLVGECRRCGEVVCRNCAIKPPAPVTLRERHRRLCKTCTHAPIATLSKPPLDPELELSSEAVQRVVCRCEEGGVWLCQPCGRSIRGADHEYQRIWRWRSQYGEILGGLGTGIGEGDRGVVCGREAECLAAKEREQQLDCDAEDARDGNSPTPDSTTPAAVDALIDELRLSHARTPSPLLGPGYERHEVEGIGGIVKRTRVRMVRVGACVPEWDDERGSGSRVLGREVRGVRRSWCGWCWRVIPGEKDTESPCGGSSSSGGSRRTSTSTTRST